MVSGEHLSEDRGVVGGSVPEGIGYREVEEKKRGPCIANDPILC
jgi:hypothetical protein